METMTSVSKSDTRLLIIAQLRRDGNYDNHSEGGEPITDHSTTKTGWKL